MKIVILMLFVIASLFAKSQESCYTVGLISLPHSEENLNRLQEENYPQSCKLMEIEKHLQYDVAVLKNSHRLRSKKSNSKMIIKRQLLQAPTSIDLMRKSLLKIIQKTVILCPDM